MVIQKDTDDIMEGVCTQNESLTENGDKKRHLELDSNISNLLDSK